MSSFLLSLVLIIYSRFSKIYSLYITAIVFCIYSVVSFSFFPSNGDIFFFSIANIIFPIAFIYSSQYFQPYKNKAYILLGILLATYTTLLVQEMDNKIYIFILYELLSLITIPMIYLSKAEGKMESLKTYCLILFSVSAVIFLPILLLLENFHQYTPLGQALIIALSMFGVGKLAIAPFHIWLPKAMVADYPISGLLHGVAVVTMGMVCLMKIYYEWIGITYIHQNPYIIYISAIPIVSMTYAGIKALYAKKIKHILAYSTIAQVSFIVVSMLFTQNPEIIVKYIVAHSIVKLFLFIIAGMIYKKYHIEYIGEISQCTSRLYLVSIIFASFSLSPLPFSLIYFIKNQISIGYLFDITSSIFTLSYCLRFIYPALKKLIRKEIDNTISYFIDYVIIFLSIFSICFFMKIFYISNDINIVKQSIIIALAIVTFKVRLPILNAPKIAIYDLHLPDLGFRQSLLIFFIILFLCLLYLVV